MGKGTETQVVGLCQDLITKRDTVQDGDTRRGPDRVECSGDCRSNDVSSLYDRLRPCAVEVSHVSCSRPRAQGSRHSSTSTETLDCRPTPWCPLDVPEISDYPSMQGTCVNDVFRVFSSFSRPKRFWFRVVRAFSSGPTDYQVLRVDSPFPRLGLQTTKSPGSIRRFLDGFVSLVDDVRGVPRCY